MQHDSNENHDKIRLEMESISQWMAKIGLNLEELVESTGLDKEVVEAVISGNYTPSPLQRESLATALGVSKNDIAWGHKVPVQHLYGHGPQFGRTP